MIVSHHKAQALLRPTYHGSPAILYQHSLCNTHMRLVYERSPSAGGAPTPCFQVLSFANSSYFLTKKHLSDVGLLSQLGDVSTHILPITERHSLLPTSYSRRAIATLSSNPPEIQEPYKVSKFRFNEYMRLGIYYGPRRL